MQDQDTTINNTGRSADRHATDGDINPAWAAAYSAGNAAGNGYPVDDLSSLGERIYTAQNDGDPSIYRSEDGKLIGISHDGWAVDLWQYQVRFVARPDSEDSADYHRIVAAVESATYDSYADAYDAAEPYGEAKINEISPAATAH